MIAIAGEELKAGDAIEIRDDGKAYKIQPKAKKQAPHGEYEVINPSDECFLTGAGEPLAAACVFLGEGKYGLREKDKDTEPCPLFLFGGVDGWWKDQFGRTFDEYMATKPHAQVAAVLDTFRYARRRSSMNNIGKRAASLARALRAKAEEV